MATRLLLAFRQAELDRWTMLHDAAKAVVAEERFWMALLIIAVIVLTAFLAAWMLELSRPETSAGPARDHSRRALLPTVVAALACAAIAGVAIVLISATPNPPVTIAWTGIRAPAPAVPLEIGGGEHRAVTAWPGGGTWPSVRIESPHPQHCLVTTRGGYGFVRSGKVYFNGVAIREGSAPQELAPFWIDVADGHLRIRTGAQLPPLLSVELTEPNERWARSLGQLLALSLYDLRSRGAVRLEVLNSLERWASSIRVIVIDEKTIQVLAPNQTPAPAARLDWTSEGGVFQAPLEIVWPGKRLIGRLALHDGAVQLTFEPPWETASPLPPFEQGHATLTFTRVPRLGTNSFILPLGEPAGDFVHATELQQTDEGALFIAGANPIPKKSEDGGLPSWVRRIGQRPSRMAEARRSTLSSEEIPITVGRRVRAVLTMTIAKAGPVAGAVALALSVAWVLFVLAFCALWAGHAHLFRVRDLWVLACVLVAAWALLAVRLLLAVRYVLDPRAVDDVTVKGLASSLGGLVMLPLFVSLAALLWAQFASEVQGKRRGRWRVIAIAAMAAGGTAFEYLLMPGRVLPVLPERYQPAWSDPLMLAAFGIALLAIWRAYSPKKYVESRMALPNRDRDFAFVLDRRVEYPDRRRERARAELHPGRMEGLARIEAQPRARALGSRGAGHPALDVLLRRVRAPDRRPLLADRTPDVAARGRADRRAQKYSGWHAAAFHGGTDLGRIDRRVSSGGDRPGGARRRRSDLLRRGLPASPGPAAPAHAAGTPGARLHHGHRGGRGTRLRRGAGRLLRGSGQGRAHPGPRGSDEARPGRTGVAARPRRADERRQLRRLRGRRPQCAGA
jgi:hypothetical protein